MKKIIFTLIGIISCITVFAQETISETWKAMPDSIIPYFNTQLRAELIDNYKMSNNTQTKNLLEGYSSVKVMTDRFLDIKLNKSVDLQLMLLPASDSTNIICMVKSYGSPVLESKIYFYSTSWQKLSDNFSLPNANDFKQMEQLLICKPDTMPVEDFYEIKKLIEPVMISATLQENNDRQSITFSVNTPLLNTDEKLRLDRIKRQKTFKWNGKIFK